MPTRLGTALLQTVLKFEGGKKGLVVDGMIGPRTRSAYATSGASVIAKVKSVIDSVGLNVEDIVGDVTPTPKPLTPFETVVKKVMVAAERAGLIPLAVAAQITAESSWGKSGLSSRWNNYAGIKYNAMDGYPGKPVKSTHMLTQEFVDGKMVTISDGFAAFDDIDHFVDGYIWYLLESAPARKRYRGLTNAKTVEEYFQILKDGGYATDPDYVRKGVAVSRSVQTRMPHLV